MYGSREKGGEGGRGVVQSPLAADPWMRSSTSAFVGFWPQARRRSPSEVRGIRPLPRLSKRAKASL